MMFTPLRRCYHGRNGTRARGVCLFFHAQRVRNREPSSSRARRMRARYNHIFSLSCPVSNHKQKWRLLCLVWMRSANDVFTLNCRSIKTVAASTITPSGYLFLWYYWIVFALLRYVNGFYILMILSIRVSSNVGQPRSLTHGVVFPVLKCLNAEQE